MNILPVILDHDSVNSVGMLLLILCWVEMQQQLRERYHRERIGRGFQGSHSHNNGILMFRHGTDSKQHQFFHLHILASCREHNFSPRHDQKWSTFFTLTVSVPINSSHSCPKITPNPLHRISYGMKWTWSVKLVCYVPDWRSYNILDCYAVTNRCSGAMEKTYHAGSADSRC